MSITIEVKSAIDKWKNNAVNDEWYFKNFRDDLLSRLDSACAFSVIDEIIPILLNENDDYVFIEVIELIQDLARKSQTTEVPPALFNNWGSIEERLKKQGGYAAIKLEELASYYRIQID